MSALYIILIFVFGLIIGSFLNVLILRQDSLKTILTTRSHCMNCKAKLGWLDLIPLVSYFLLKGKCRYCQQKISPQYPAVEFGTGLLFVFLLLNFGISWALLFYVIVFSLLTVVLVTDLKTEMVPELFVWISLALVLVFGWYFAGITIWYMILGGLIGGGVLAFLVYASGEKWMGAGDIKIGVILGLIAGYPIVILGIFFAFVLGAVVGLIYVWLKGKTMKDSLPFAPFLIISALFCITYGKYLLSWYFGSLIFF